MSSVLFVEDARQAVVLGGGGVDLVGTEVVAVTAEAWWALERQRIRCTPICEYSTARALATPGKAELAARCTELTSALDAYFLDHSHVARSHDLRVGTDQWYRLFVTMELVLTRAYHILNALKVRRPRLVRIFRGPCNAEQRQFGFDQQSPLVHVLPPVCRSLGVSLEVLDAPVQPFGPRPARWRMRGIARRVTQVPRGALWMLSRAVALTSRASRLGRTRLLFIDGAIGYDWAPVIQRLGRQDACEMWVWPVGPGPAFEQPFEGVVESLSGGRAVGLPAGGLASSDPLVADELRKTYAGWLAEEGQITQLEVLGVDLMPALVDRLRAGCTDGVVAMLVARAQSDACLDAIAPDVVCYFGITSAPWIQLARRCWERRVPVLTFQHGGIYGSHAVPYHPEIDGKWSDLFLCYSRAIADYFEAYGASEEGTRRGFRARSVAVGSTRVEAMRRRGYASRVRRDRECFRVLYISEFPTQNLAHGHELEDTLRFRHQRAVIEWFAMKPDLDLIFRPFPLRDYHDPVVEYIRGLERPRVTVDPSSPLETLIRQADLVLADITGTVWGEVLALGKLLVIYHDPEQALMTPAALGAIRRSALFCGSEAEFFDTVKSLLTGDPWENCRRRKADLTDEFLLDYVICRDDGRCVERAVTAVLDTIATKQRP